MIPQLLYWIAALAIVYVVAVQYFENRNQRKMMIAIETLTASVAALGVNVSNLNAAIDHAIEHIAAPSATDAQLATLAGAIDSLSATLVAQATRLTDATAAVEPPAPSA
jgi:hypothetical protein